MKLYIALCMTVMVTSAIPNNRRIDSIEPDKAEEPQTEVNDDTVRTEPNHRHKRWYPYGGGYPPLNPLPYPPVNSFFNYREEDPLREIYRKIKDLTSATATYSAQQPQIPFYYPVIILPFNCRCGTKRPNKGTNGTSPGIDNRFPEMEDTRQNWGFDVESDSDDTDFARPISLVPAQPPRPVNVRPPPVEHGSSQAGVDSISTEGPTTAAPVIQPDACDAAVLYCCHQPQVTAECFNSRGCQNTAQFDNNPCNAKTVFDIIDRYQQFYRRFNN